MAKPHMDIPRFSKTRIAPTPSGYLHLGNVLSFALTAALSQKTGAKILLRIDDLDRDRVNRLYVQDIFDTLNFLEIPYDEGPRNFKEYEQEWSQVHRMGYYFDALQKLRQGNAIFACECSRAQVRSISADDSYPGICRLKNLPLDAKNVSWRLKTDATPIFVKTFTGGIIEAAMPVSMQNFVVRKKDGYPAYQITSVLDDLYHGVDLIVRGADLWESTLAQQYLALKTGAGGFSDITFYHHQLLTAPDGGKLSKSAGALSVQYLRGQGKSREDIYTVIAAMLGKAEAIKSWQELAFD